MAPARGHRGRRRPATAVLTRTFHADPTPFLRLDSTLRRLSTRPRPPSPQPMPAVPGRPAAHRTRLLPPHHRRRLLRRRHRNPPLFMPRLQAHRVPAPGVRPALSALRHSRHRRLSNRPPRRTYPGRLAPPRRALSARPVLDAPLPRARRIALRLARRPWPARPGGGLPPARHRHAHTPRLDPRPSFPVRHPPPAPARLASLARSRRPPRRAFPRPGPAAPAPTNHLPGLPRPAAPYWARSQLIPKCPTNTNPLPCSASA